MELWIFDWYLPCKSIKNHGCCTNLCELLVGRKIIKILMYIIHIMGKLVKKIEKVWMSNLWFMSFWLNLPYKSVYRYECCSNFWELLDWNKISKSLLKILHNIFQLPTKFHEFWKWSSRVMNFWSNNSVLRENTIIASIFMERRLFMSVYKLVCVWECVQRCI